MIKVTAAFKAHQVPLLLAALLAAIAVYARMLPWSCASAPITAEEPRTKYTLQGRALLINTILERAAAVNVVLILKMNCFLASPPALRVRVPDKVTSDVGNVYTPGSKVIPPRFDDGSAAVAGIDCALYRVNGSFS